jgi:capsular polysaccharide transport system permease protein
MASLESATAEAQRKQLYLERLVQPNTPDVATEPKRIKSILEVFALGMIAWGVLSLLLAGVREHHD